MASENHSNGTLNFQKLQTEGLKCSEIKVRWVSTVFITKTLTEDLRKSMETQSL